MTVFNNVMVGTHCRTSSGFAENALRLPKVPAEEEEARARAWALLDLLELRPCATTLIGDLPFGTQKRVELARALACSPQLLLLDEPAGGLNHAEVEALGTLILAIRYRGVTI